MIRSVLQIPNFRRFWLGQTLLWLAEQGWFVGLTWLVLQQTGSGLAVGAVLMAGAIPTAIFALVGGAVSDRFPAKLVATVANLANTFLAGILTILIWLDAIRLPLLIAIAALAGLADAFAYPAINILPPRFLNKARSVQATTWMQGTEQLKEAIGPALAGLAIARLGLPMSFAFYTVLFAIGSGLIFSIHVKQKPARKHSPENFYTSEQQPHEVTSLVGEIMTGLRYAWWHPALRFSLLLIAVLNFAANGPLVIGGAELVIFRFGGDAAMFGNLQGAFGIGSLIGILLGNRFESLKNPGMALTWLAYFLSFGLTSLAFVHQPWIAFAVMAGMGIGSGIVSIIAIVWLQQQTKQHMRGRIISLVMFVSIALDPFSQAISGFLSSISLTLLFLASGTTMLLAALLASFHRTNSKSVKESLPYDV